MEEIKLSQHQIAFVQTATELANSLIGEGGEITRQSYDSAVRALADAAEYLANASHSENKQSSEYPLTWSAGLRRYEEVHNLEEYVYSVEKQHLAPRRSHNPLPYPGDDVASAAKHAFNGLNNFAGNITEGNPLPSLQDVQSAVDEYCLALSVLENSQINAPTAKSGVIQSSADVAFAAVATCIAIDYLVVYDDSNKRNQSELKQGAVQALLDVVNHIAGSSLTPRGKQRYPAYCYPRYITPGTPYYHNLKQYIACTQEP